MFKIQKLMILYESVIIWKNNFSSSFFYSASMKFLESQYIIILEEIL